MIFLTDNKITNNDFKFKKISRENMISIIEYSISFNNLISNVDTNKIKIITGLDIPKDNINDMKVEHILLIKGNKRYTFWFGSKKFKKDI